MRATGIAAGLGCSIVVTIVIFILGGVLLDRKLGTEPWLTLAGIGVAITAAAYQLYELATVERAAGELGPVARGLGRIVPARRKLPIGGDNEPENHR